MTDQHDFVIVGIRSILGLVPNPQEVFSKSAEANISPLHTPELAEKIEGAPGEGSSFQDTYGHHADATKVG